MSNLASRVLVVLVGLPLVLGVVWLGGWWLCVLAGAVGLLALHEFYAMTRALRPIVIAGYLGLALTLVSAQAGGFVWVAGSLFATVALAFLLKGLADTRQSATVAVGGTVLGVTWIGLGLVALLALRALPEHGRLAAFTVLIAVWAGDTFAYLVGRVVGRHKLAPKISPGKTWEGFVGGTVATVFVTFVALYKDRDEFLSIGQVAPARCGARGCRAARRPVRVAAQAGHGREGQRPPAGRPRRRARPHRRAAVRRRRGPLLDPRLRQGLALVRPAEPCLDMAPAARCAGAPGLLPKAIVSAKSARRGNANMPEE